MGTIDARTWMEVISQAECWELLDEAPVGRLGVLVAIAPDADEHTTLAAYQGAAWRSLLRRHPFADDDQDAE